MYGYKYSNPADISDNRVYERKQATEFEISNVIERKEKKKKN